MSDSDLCQIVCPCCESILTIDDAGDVSYEEAELAELAPNEFRGLGGLVSVDARPQWRKQEYQYNQQGLVLGEQLCEPLDAPTFDAIAEEETEINEIELPTPDPDLEQAIKTDLSKRNIKTKTKTTTELK